MNQNLLNDLLTQLLTKNIDLKGRRVINAGKSQDQNDYLTRKEVFSVVNGLLSGDGSGLTNLNATQLLTGTVPNGRFPATLPAASGANLTALNATNLASGTVANARLPIVKGSWTPTNADVTLIVNSAKYWSIDTAILFQCYLSWPITADTHDSTILGLPLSASVRCAIAIGLDTSGVLFKSYLDTAAIFLTKTNIGGLATNADLSGANLILSGIAI